MTSDPEHLQTESSVSTSFCLQELGDSEGRAKRRREKGKNKNCIIRCRSYCDHAVAAAADLLAASLTAMQRETRRGRTADCHTPTYSARPGADALQTFFPFSLFFLLASARSRTESEDSAPRSAAVPLLPKKWTDLSHQAFELLLRLLPLVLQS